MGKKSTPAPPPQPDPYAVARAQTGSNVMTSIANTWLGNANETSPLGTVDYRNTGYQTVTDPSNGQTYQIPTFERTTTMSPEQQTLYDQQVGLGWLSNNIAGDQLTRVNDLISRPVDTSALPRRIDSIAPTPGFERMPGGPELYQYIGDPNIAGFDPSVYGGLQREFADVGGPQRRVGPTDFSQDRQRVEEALYSRLNPQLERDRAALESTLVNQGFARGSEAFNREMDAFNRQANDARMGVVRAGGEEQSRLAGLDFQRFGLENQAEAQAYQQALERARFGNEAGTQDLQNRIAGNVAQNTAAGLDWDQRAQNLQFYNTSQQQTHDNLARSIEFNNKTGQQEFANTQDAAAFQNTARERALQEALALRNQPLNEIAALMNGGQVTMPQFTQFRPGQVDPTPVGNYVYQGYNTAMNGYNQQLQANAASRAGMYNLGAAVLGTGARTLFSDRRLKRDIAPLATGAHGLTLYRYRYIFDNDNWHLGYMADEVAAVRPEAVAANDDGFLMLDYGAL